jgi:hypothetical protein
MFARLTSTGLNPTSNATKTIEVYLNEFASKKSCLVTSSIGFCNLCDKYFFQRLRDLGLNES